MTFNDIAFYIGDTQVLWHGIIIGISLPVAVIAALILRFIQRENAGAVMLTAAFSCIFCPVLARLFYWYCCSGQFSSFISAMTDYSKGGFSIVGVAAGVFLAMLAVRFMRVADDLGRLVDCVIPAGILGVAVARLAGFFSSADKGKIIVESESFHRLPFSFPITNSLGELEWRLPVFLYEAIAAFVIFVIIFIIFVFVYSGEKNTAGQSGTIPGLLAISMFSLSQACLESMRYDTLYMRSNGFVSFVQIIFAILALVPFFIFAARLIRAKLFGAEHIMTGSILFVLLAAAGFMEYLVQRYVSEYIKWYLIMGAALTGVFLIICFFCADRHRKGASGV